MKDIELLKKAREIISKPENWTKNSFAKDAYGCSTMITNKEAVCFCSIGAVRRALDVLDYPDDGEVTYHSAIDRLRQFVHTSNRNTGSWATLAGYNDHADRTHTDILAMFDKAIANDK